MAIYTHEEIDGNLIDNSAKKELITEIKEIISEYGVKAVKVNNQVIL